MRVGLEIWATIKPQHRFEFLQTFSCEPTAEESHAGCLSRTLYENTGKPHQFLWVEQWRSAEALNAYRQSERYRSLLGAIEVLGELDNEKTYIYSSESI